MVARVDEVVALLLLAAIQLHVWLSSHVDHRIAEALAARGDVGGGDGAPPLATGRPAGRLCRGTAQDAVGGRLTQSTSGAIMALILVFYAAVPFRTSAAPGVGLVIALAAAASPS